MAIEWKKVLTEVDIIDEDTMSSNLDTKVPTQQSVKAYVDAQISGGSAVDNIVRDDLVMLAWELQKETGLGSLGFEDGVTDEFEDEAGIDGTASQNESYNETYGYYAPTTSIVVDNMEYSSDALAQSAYVSDAATYDSYTKLLLHMDGKDKGTTFTDETGKTVTRYGALTRTSLKVFGTASGKFDGDGDYLSLADHDDWALGSTWTVDFWVYSNQTGSQGYFGQVVDANDGWGLRSNIAGTELSFEVGYTSWSVSWANCIATSAWHHIALVCNNNVLKLYYDGTEKTITGTVGSVASLGDWATPFLVGASFCASIGTFTTNGYIDEFRVSKGVARWTSNFTPPTSAYPNSGSGGGAIFYLQSYSESTIKTQGSYSLKGVAAATDSLNKTLTRAIGSPIDLSGVDTLKFYIRSSRTGSNIKIGLHDSGGTTTEITPNITSADTFQKVSWDLSGVADANKDVIDSIIVTIVNADSANTFYVDGLAGPLNNMTLISESKEAESEPTTARLLALIEPVDSITINTDLLAYISNDGGSNYDQVTLAKVATYDETKDIYAGNVTLTDRSDQTMVQKIVTANGKNVKIHAWAMLWR